MKIARLFEWVLVLWICYGDGVAIDHIDGFNKNLCFQAGAQLTQTARGSGTGIAWTCIEK